MIYSNFFPKFVFLIFTLQIYGDFLKLPNFFATFSINF
nr:MAG TPA: hypothetical protein [Caudoviricetes sp.]